MGTPATMRSFGGENRNELTENHSGRTVHTCFEDGDYCDFKLKIGAELLPYWPPVFRQDNPYK